jgi:hypothetical protein
MAERSSGNIRVISWLLLALLTSNLLHSHVHGRAISSIHDQQSAQNILPGPYGENNSSNYYKVPPCLLCTSQRQKIAVLSTQAFLVSLVRIDTSSIEPVQHFRRQPYLPIYLSRAPPPLG